MLMFGIHFSDCQEELLLPAVSDSLTKEELICLS